MEWYDFWAWVKPVPNSECWEFSKPGSPKRQGTINKMSNTFQRLVFEECVGPIGFEGVVAVCQNPNCVRPTHLSYFRDIRKLNSCKT